MKALQRLPIYELAVILQTGHIEAVAFLMDLKNDPEEGLKMLRSFKAGAENLFHNFDRRFITLCKGNEFELTDWASRMRFVQSQLDEIDRQLAVAQTRLFNWETAARAMGYVNAFRTASEQIINHNEEHVPA